MLKRLWMDESGALLSAELVLLMTLLICGTVVGTSALRTAVVTELADVGSALGSINQSFSYGGTTGHHASCTGSAFTDGVDSCDDAAAGVGAGVTQPTGANSRCVTVCVTFVGGEAGTAFVQAP